MPSNASFKKEHIDAPSGELNSDYKDMPESEQLHRHKKKDLLFYQQYVL